MSEKIELNLEALEAAAKACGDDWYENRDIGNVLDLVSDEDNRFVVDASPLVVIELVRRLRVAEALVAARVEQIPTEARTVAVFADIRPEFQADLEEFAEAIKKRCTSGRWTLVAFFPSGADIQSMDAEQMRAAGWVRAKRGDE